MNYLALLEEYHIEGELKEEEFLTLCPFHNDTHPSCSINIVKGVFKCFSCAAKGDIYALLAAKTNVSKSTIKKHIEGAEPLPAELSFVQIEEWHKRLLKSERLKEELKRKGIEKGTLTQRLIGYDGQRITIPILDKDSQPCNIRRWLPKAIKQKVISIKGLGKNILYPYDQLLHDPLIITEGELKALLLIQKGFHAVTSTCGVGSWVEEWGVLFKGKTVYLCLDIDKAGLRSIQKIAPSLYKHTKQIYVIKLPLDADKYPKGDVTDYFIKAEHSKGDFQGLIKKAKLWEPFIYKEEFDDNVYPVTLAESTKAKFANKIVKTEVVVSAKDTAPYIVPYHIKVVCPRDQDVCAFCTCFNQDEFKIDKKHPTLLELIGVSTERQAKAIKKLIGIPRSCQAFNIKVLESMNIEEIKMIPQLSIAYTNSQHVIQQGFYIGHGIETNSNYSVLARVCTLPDSQYATLLIFEATPTMDNLTTFKLQDDLTLFQPSVWTVEAIHKKLNELYTDLEYNVTHIYQRINLHFFYDLCYHSVLYLPFQNRVIKGWIEGLVIGDSGQGKSETIINLIKHYKLGEKIDAKTSSVAGLIGGLQEFAKRWFISWGILPLNDKRLVILEEFKGISQDIIAHLTEVRSSGIAEVSKVEKARTNARVRLICISNPRSERQIQSYNYGVESIKELIGNLEDIRRFDIAIILSALDIDSAMINLSLKSRNKVKHTFKSELCNQLILWGWSRKPDEIILLPETIDIILQEASRLSSEYSAKIPLIEAADQRLKLARLATALAVRTFSTEDNIRLTVRPCHAEYIVKFLRELYASSTFGYKDYSELLKKENTISNIEEITTQIQALPFAKSVVETFLDTRVFSVWDIMDWTELEPDLCKKFIGLLVRGNAIKRYKRGYVKNPSFIALLKTLKRKGLINETTYTKASNEEF